MRAKLRFLAVLLACGCAGAPPPSGASSPHPIASASAPTATPIASATAHVLARSAVQGVVSQGLGSFLQHVDLDDQPALSGGKFRGFRIASLRGAFWSGVDLLPGDVVTGVNGLPIERPEQAQMAFDAIAAAAELRVAYERNGQPRELVYRIVDGR
jgi:type II secretory pathway component PulC